MLKSLLPTLLLAFLSASCLSKRISGFGPERRNPNTVVHMRHQGLHVWISIQERKNEPSTVEVSIPVPFSFNSPPVPPIRSRDLKVKVTLLEQDTFFEGKMTPNHISVINAGSTTDRYELPLAPGIAIGHVHSVTLWIEGREYQFFPF